MSLRLAARDYWDALALIDRPRTPTSRLIAVTRLANLANHPHPRIARMAAAALDRRIEREPATRTY